MHEFDSDIDSLLHEDATIAGLNIPGSSMAQQESCQNDMFYHEHEDWN